MISREATGMDSISSWIKVYLEIILKKFFMPLIIFKNIINATHNNGNFICSAYLNKNS